MKKMSDRFNEKTNGLLNFADLKKVRFKVLYWGMFAMLFFFTLVCIVPAIWALLSGFKTTEEMYRVPPTILPEVFHWENIKIVWDKVAIMKNFVNSVYIIIGCLLFDVIFNGLAGYVLSRIKPKGSAIVETLIFWSMLLPTISMVPLYITFVDLPILHVNLTGQFTPLWLIAGANAFNVLLFRSFFNGIPMSYVEAARIDGCSNLSIFGRIILPLSKPIIMVVSIFSITSSWSSFMWPYLILGSTDKVPVAVRIYELSTKSVNIQDNEMMMLILFSIIPPLIMYALFSKQIMGGLDMSGIKG